MLNFYFSFILSVPLHILWKADVFFISEIGFKCMWNKVEDGKGTICLINIGPQKNVCSQEFFLLCIQISFIGERKSIMWLKC